ncbi:hypothetical protein QF021_002753 [Acidovorax delafieldii]|nr:hypothetical protein [Acidovorax delafieldii]
MKRQHSDQFEKRVHTAFQFNRIVVGHMRRFTRPTYIAQILGASPSNLHNTSRQATRTALSSFIAGST